MINPLNDEEQRKSANIKLNKQSIQKKKKAKINEKLVDKESKKNVEQSFDVNSKNIRKNKFGGKHILFSNISKKRKRENDDERPNKKRKTKNGLPQNILIIPNLEKYSEMEIDRIFYNHKCRRTALMCSLRKFKNQNSSLPHFKVPTHLKITVTCDVKIASKWIQKNVLIPCEKETIVVGLDREGDCVLILNEKPNEICNTAILQISTRTHCLLFQTKLGNIKPPIELKKMFLHKNVKKIWIGMRNDVNELNIWFRKYNWTLPNDPLELTNLGFIDLSNLVKTLPSFPVEKNKQQLGIVFLCEFLFKQYFEKNPQNLFSRWTKKELTKEQIEYATKDAYFTCIAYFKYLEMINE